MFYFKLFILKLFLICVTSDSPIVTVHEGMLRGKEMVISSGYTYFTFRGIPYAAPPVGELRFKEPQAAKSWKGYRNATEFGSICAQLYDNVVTGSEDCLFLNVHTPTLDTSSLHPVLVFMHGGGYATLSGNVTPDIFMKRNVILVTLNYRLEALGFLSLGIEEVPGNAGLKDQVAALKWIQDNISSFGGDPEDITIFGHSSGSMAISLHLLSDISRNYFQKAILMSGIETLINEDVLNPLEDARNFAKVLGNDSSDPNELYEFYMAEPFENLVGAKERLASIYTDVTREYVFVPVIEENFNSTNMTQFITIKPLEILATGGAYNVPIIAGFNSGEKTITDFDFYLDLFESSPEKFLPIEVRNLRNITVEEVHEKIFEVYPDYNGTAVSDILSDSCFHHPTVRYFNLYTDSNNSNVFMYYFNYLKDGEVLAFHGEEIKYLFSTEKEIASLSDLQRSISEFLITSLTNFASNGKPNTGGVTTIEWLPYSRYGKNFMTIEESFYMTQDPLSERMSFFEWMYAINKLVH